MARRNASQDYGADWRLGVNDDGTYTIERVQAVLLQEIRDEMKKLNRLLHCQNFIGIPRTLNRIGKRLAAKRPARKARKS